jgi:hypothetical protein
MYSKKKIPIATCLLVWLCLLPAVPSLAASETDDAASYHTPLAGAPCDIECFGRKYILPPRNRENTAALVLGGSFFAPNLAGTRVLPIGAFYWRHRWDDTRVRGTFSGVVNDFGVSRGFGRFELLGHLDNNTIPVARKEIDGGVEVTGSAVNWGTVNGRLGIGWRLPVAPYQIDNDLKLQLFYQGGYLYSQRSAETSASVKLPPATPVHGPLFRFRYDGLSRNLMELPHRGVAAGADLEFLQRADWSDASYGGAPFSGEATRRYLKLSGYLDLVGGLPLLSERHRVLASFYGGFAPYGTLDRFSAFRIGGGPTPSESDDLERQVFPGALFGQFPAAQYLIAALEYRRELFSFLYLHLRGTYGWLEREVFSGDRQLASGGGQALSAALTSGFFWKSELHLEYSYDSSLLRDGTTGSNIILLWSKSF